MRKFLVLSLFALSFLTGCAAASPVTLSWNYPRFNAIAQGSCTPSTVDSLKDLSRVQIWRQNSGQTDSTLVLDRAANGKEGQPDSTIVQQPEGTSFYWAVLFDLIGNKSCRSNLASKQVIQPPAPATMN
jgi:hypothetical protein